MAQYRFFILLFCLVLPACFYSEKQITKKTYKKISNKGFQDDCSIFTPLSEMSVRDDVREAHKLEASSVEELNEDQKRKPNKHLSRKKREILVAERAREQQAKLIDIPIPLNVEPINDFFDTTFEEFQAITLGYRTDLSVDDVMTFYQEEMERHGWRVLADVHGAELFVQFIKPGRFCSVSIRSGERTKGRRGNTDIIIFTGPASICV